MADPRYDLAEREIRRAARCLPLPGSAPVAFQEKNGHADIVSKYDKEVEMYLAGQILTAFPGDGIVGEEMEHPHGGGWIWYIDPIDGTTNFVSQLRNYAISIACYCQGEPVFGLVYDVAEDRLYHARAGGGAFCNGQPITSGKRTALKEMILYTPIVQGTLIDDHPLLSGMRRLAGDVRAVRSLGSVALELCAVAAGEADLFLAERSCPWDHNAARIILAEAGGAMLTWAGAPVPVDRRTNLMAAGRREVLEQIAAVYWTK